jgi:hypothetical protein
MALQPETTPTKKLSGCRGILASCGHLDAEIYERGIEISCLRCANPPAFFQSAFHHESRASLSLDSMLPNVTSVVADTRVGRLSVSEICKARMPYGDSLRPGSTRKANAPIKGLGCETRVVWLVIGSGRHQG